MPEARAGENITLAGSFNNWNTSDNAFRLVEAGDQYELVRFWNCGSYEFKFVYDGSWTRHWGEAGPGALEQPGRNIQLVIARSGEYAIRLNTQRKKWIFLPRIVTRPHAVLRLRDASSARVQLDGSASLARPNHPIREYEWTVRRRDGGPDDWQLAGDATQARPILTVSRPGTFDIQLQVDDGEYQDSVASSRMLGSGWTLLLDVDALKSPDMKPISKGVWGAVLQPAEDGSIELQVQPATARGASPVSAGSFRVQGNKRYLARYAEGAKQLTLADDGWHAFSFRLTGHAPPIKASEIERVEVAGEFNRWRPGWEMQSNPDGSEWMRIVELPDGIHHYKFLINGSVWTEDSNADSRFRESDGAGGYNSGLLIGPDAARFGPAPPDQVVDEAIRHLPTSPAFFSPISKRVARVTVQTLENDVKSVFVRRAGKARPIPLTRSDARSGFDHWTAHVGSDDNRELVYSFAIRDGRDEVQLGAHGATHGRDVIPLESFRSRLAMSFETPDWAKRAVWYQIFPERFRNGDPTNDPPRTVPWTHAWFKPYRPHPDRVSKGSPREFTETGTFYEYIFLRRYGGDLQGVREKLPYLRDLGITALYFNPLFQAESLHKYDASDYRHIDDFFGVKGSLAKIRGETEDPETWQWSKSDLLFREFLKEAHRKGFRVILDGVFNHTGRDFWAFRDILENGKKSKYADWFDITSWDPFHYRAWDKDDGALPRLKHDDALGLAEPIREHIFAITRRWMDPDGDGDPRDGIDGWRLDVAGDINANFWRDWRVLVKSINPDAYIVAELWQESREWLDGQTFDAVMNYPLAERAQRFFVNQKQAIRPKEFAKQLDEILGWYPPQVNYVLQNLYNSHDTDRLASMFMNPDLEYDKANRLQDNGAQYNTARPTSECYQKLKLMVTFQMTFPGAPMVYYGDEVGMYGADDPSDRKPMYWEDLMPFDDPDERILPDVFEHYRRLIAIRNTYPALQLGSYRVLLADDRKGIFAFERALDNESVVVVLNNSDKSHRLNVPVQWDTNAVVVRLDDPVACALSEPRETDSRARNRVAPVEPPASKLRVEEGHLRGGLLSPRTGGIFKAISPES